MPLLSATPARATEQRSLRFLLAIQRSRVVAYSLAGAVALVGKAAGVLEVGYGAWLSVAAGMVSAVLVEAVIRRDPDRRLRLDANLASMLLDSGLITWGVCATGGLQSPWFLWYLSNAGAAAFTSGRKGAVLVAGVNTLAYMGALFWMGQIRGLDAGFWQAVVGMAFLFAAAYSCLRGVSRLQDSRAQLRRLREDEHLKVDELIRLTQDLDQGTRALAEANLQIREADRVKSQFLANMSHELRTPLNSIIGFSEILRERLADDLNPRHLKFLANIHSSGQHLLGIINDILDLSKVEAGKMEVNAEELAAIPAVEGVLGVMQGMAGKRGITFEVDAPPDLPPIETDPAKFKQILYNLLSNAVKFSPEGEVVRIELRAQLAAESPLHEDSLSLAVVDRGIGIAPEDLEVIFHEFRQADGTVGRAFGGTGLGLALVKKFVELQSGQVTVDSVPGQGSVFLVTLPLRSRVVPAEAPVPTAPHLPGANRVLVVEDDMMAYQTLARGLSEAGYFPVRARLGEEALQMARLLKPTALTLDLALPDLSGWEVLKGLKRDTATREIPVVIVSIMDNQELGLALGADDYFVKPVDRPRLIARLQELAPLSGAPRGGRLLLIDDDPAVHDVLDEALVPLGYTVDHAFSGHQGLDQAMACTPDVVILDLLMPDVSGFEVAEALQEREETSHVPIVVLTFKDLTARERESLRGKIAAFVQKGHTGPRQLVSAIRELESRHGREGDRGR